MDIVLPWSVKLLTDSWLAAEIIASRAYLVWAMTQEEIIEKGPLPKDIVAAASSKMLWDIDEYWWDSTVIQMFLWSKSIVKLYPLTNTISPLIIELYHKVHRHLSSLGPFCIQVPEFSIQGTPVSTLSVRVLDLDPNLIGLSCSTKTQKSLIVTNNHFVSGKMFQDVVDNEKGIPTIEYALATHLSNASGLRFDTLNPIASQISLYNMKFLSLDENGCANVVITDIAVAVPFFILFNLLHKPEELAILIGMALQDLLDEVKRTELSREVFAYIGQKLGEDFLCEVIRSKLFAFDSVLKERLAEAYKKGYLTDKLSTALIESGYIETIESSLN